MKLLAHIWVQQGWHGNWNEYWKACPMYSERNFKLLFCSMWISSYWDCVMSLCIREPLWMTVKEKGRKGEQYSLVHIWEWILICLSSGAFCFSRQAPKNHWQLENWGQKSCSVNLAFWELDKTSWILFRWWFVSSALPFYRANRAIVQNIIFLRFPTRE